MSIFRRKAKELLAPTGSFLRMDVSMIKDNPFNPYLKNYGDYKPKKVSAKFPLWKSILHIVFLPFFRK